MSEHRAAITDLDTTLGAMNAPHNQVEENFQMEEFVPDHQPESPPHFEEDPEPESSSEEPFVPTEAEKDAAERLSTFKRPAAKQPAKRPRSPLLNVDDDVPDLAEIFDNYDTPKAARVSICRAYASYLAAMMPKKPKASKKNSKK